jgi:hypothetical protein
MCESSASRVPRSAQAALIFARNTRSPVSCYSENAVSRRGAKRGPFQPAAKVPLARWQNSADRVLLRVAGAPMQVSTDPTRADRPSSAPARR